MVRSRYLRGSIRFVADPASPVPTAHFLVATPRTADATCRDAIADLEAEPRGTLDKAPWAIEVRPSVCLCREPTRELTHQCQV